MAQQLLSELSGRFSESAKYNLDKYNSYLNGIKSHTVNIQKDIKAIGKAIKDCVMVQGKWYDDTAVEFAEWWNDTKGVVDGIDKLNNISTYMEHLIRITALELSKAIDTSSQTKNSAKGYAYIQKYAKARDIYIWGVEDINKRTIGLITETTLSPNCNIEAKAAPIRTMINEVGTNLTDINTRIDKVKTSIQTNLIDGAAVKVVGLDQSTLNRYVKIIKNNLDAIQDELYVKLLEDSERHKIANTTLKNALKKDYGVK